MQQEPSMKAQLSHKLYLLNRFIEDGFKFSERYQDSEKDLFENFKSMSENERTEEISRVSEELAKFAI